MNQASPVRLAATVMLLQDTASRLEVFVLRRVAAMEFAPRKTVFPGGAVDASDHGSSLTWIGADPSWWSRELGVAETDAVALVVAAVRELFEETGVLLAGPDPGASGATRQDSTTVDRLAVLDRRVRLTAALAAAGLRLRADLLRPWANWITPPGRTRRYDTFFFAAALPAGQHAQMLTTEADLGQWRTPQALLAEHEVGSTALMPPTVAMLVDLAGFGSVADVMAERRVITPIRVRASDFPNPDATNPDTTNPDTTSRDTQEG
jgi:8-oxo-dGTP pyrophosphatase MutT (NUDIX family)